MSDPNLFDLLAAMEERDKAVAQVASNTDDFWGAMARFAILSVATTRPDFTTDDVWQELATIGVGQPHEPRAMGAIMRGLQKAGLVTPTAAYRESERPQCHRNPKRVWRLTVEGAGR